MSKTHEGKAFKMVTKGHFFRKYDALLSLPKKCAENYPELLHPVHGNDKILI